MDLSTYSSLSYALVRDGLAGDGRLAPAQLAKSDVVEVIERDDGRPEEESRGVLAIPAVGAAREVGTPRGKLMVIDTGMPGARSRRPGYPARASGRPVLIVIDGERHAAAFGSEIERQCPALTSTAPRSANR